VLLLLLLLPEVQGASWWQRGVMQPLAGWRLGKLLGPAAVVPALLRRRQRQPFRRPWLVGDLLLQQVLHRQPLRLLQLRHLLLLTVHWPQLQPGRMLRLAALDPRPPLLGGRRPAATACALARTQLRRLGRAVLLGAGRTGGLLHGGSHLGALLLLLLLLLLRQDVYDRPLLLID
jgi:hypothetical protein